MSAAPYKKDKCSSVSGWAKLGYKAMLVGCCEAVLEAVREGLHVGENSWAFVWWAIKKKN